MSVFTSAEVNKRLSHLNIIMKYMSFLQEHGFSEFGKGQLTGKMELLKEGISESTPSHPEQRFENEDYLSNEVPSSFDGYEENIVHSSTSLVESKSNIEDSNYKTRNNGDDKKYSIAHKIDEQTGVHNALDQTKGRKFLFENNRWNFKNDDESSWITRIRKLADM